MRGARLVVGAVLVIAACGSERDEPPGGSRSSSQAAGGSTAASGGGGMAPVTCGENGVLCETYEADCSAFPGMQPQWDLFWYETVIPADARVDFAMRTATSADNLSLGNFVHASTAVAGDETVPPSNPIHLDEVLDPENLIEPALELRIRGIAASDGSLPEVVSWDLTFTCVDL